MMALARDLQPGQQFVLGMNHPQNPKFACVANLVWVECIEVEQAPPEAEKTPGTVAIRCKSPTGTYRCCCDGNKDIRVV